MEALKPAANQKAEGQRLVEWYNKLKTKRSTWEPSWEELGTYLMPRKSGLLVKTSPGGKQTQWMFDGTAPKCISDLSAAIHGAMTNPAVKWFRLRMRAKELNNDVKVKQWLEDCSNRLYFAFQESNFDSEIQEVYTDLATFGVAALLMEEDELKHPGFNGFLFKTVPIGDYVISENSRGRVDVMARAYTMSYRAAADKWGMDKLSPNAQAKVKGQPEDDIELLHFIYPRSTGTKSGPTAGAVKRFASVHLELAEQHILAEGGYDEFPGAVCRWTKNGREVYGRGPGHIAIPDVKTLNRLVEISLKALAKIVDPPLFALDDAVVGNASINPAEVTTVRSKDAIWPLEIGAHFDKAMVNMDRLETRVRQAFYADLLQLPDKSIITAAEVSQRVEHMQKILGPTLGRIAWELLSDIIVRGFALMYRAGVMPPPPAIVLQSASGEIDVEYEGPLTRSQRLSDLESIQRGLNLVAPLAQQRPETMDNLDDDILFCRIWELSGAPIEALRDKDSKAQIRQAREAAAAEQQKAQAMQQMAESVGKAAPGMKVMNDAGMMPDMGSMMEGAMSGNPVQ